MKICTAQFKKNCTDKLFIYSTYSIDDQNTVLISKGPKFQGKIRKWNFLSIVCFSLQSFTKLCAAIKEEFNTLTKKKEDLF